MNSIAYTNSEGGTAIVVPAPKEAVEKVLGALTDEQYESYVRERSIPANAINVINVTEALPSREFRNAWVIQDKTIIHDLEKARSIQLDRIRIIRDKHMKMLDVNYMRAVEAKDDSAQEVVANHKQRLRDITEPLKIMALTSIDDIKNAWPNELPKEFK
jgi:hypothetical protein